uniref:Putative ovule protein n=1 Tax=Solanum chacoense TaxID=4108 RepID=A0A0V0IC99_SOLCH
MNQPYNRRCRLHLFLLRSLLLWKKTVVAPAFISITNTSIFNTILIDPTNDHVLLTHHIQTINNVLHK